jgi:Carboxypeptidase regulatory-like domain
MIGQRRRSNQAAGGIFRFILIIAALVTTFGISPVRSFGQAVTGTIVGGVVDSSGGVIIGANITATNVATGVTFRATTVSGGFYTLSYLPAGTYNVTAKYKGFKTGVAQNNVVQVGQPTRVDFTLSPGEVTQTVQVSGAAPLVQTTSSDITTVVGNQQITALPLNGRLFQSLVFLVPGTTPQAWGDQNENPAGAGSVNAGGPGNGTYASVNGFFFAGNLWLVDGVHDNEPQNDYININVPFTDIAEMSIQTSNPTAEYGTFGGAVINVTTKSGTNHFHGSAFDFIRNAAFNSKDYFAKVTPHYVANQFGGAIGGPILKDKLFFFGDFQDLHQSAGTTNTFTVPTMTERNGDLSDLVSGGAGPITNAAACQTIAAANGAANPVPCTASSAVTVAGTYDTVPAADISPIATALFNPTVYAPTTQAGVANNAVYNVVNTETDPQFDVRLDYALSDRDRFFGRESYLHRDFNAPSAGTIFMNVGNSPSISYNRNHSGVLAWDHFFSPTMTNEARFGFNRYATVDFNNAHLIEQNNALGIPNGNISGLPITTGIAQFNFNNSPYASTGDPGYLPNGLGRLANIFEYDDNLTKIMGRHSLKFGTDIERLQTSVRNAQSDPRGQFNFGGGYTGNTLADLLVGGPTGVNRDLFPSSPATRVIYAGFFVQDDFRVNPEFTLNLGLRWDVYTKPVDAHNAQSNFIGSGPNAGMIQMASSSNRGPNLSTYFGNWEPRFGFAYSPDNGKTALRAGFGISAFPDNFGGNGGTLERNYPETLQEVNSSLTSNCTTAFTNPNPAEFSPCGSLILANGLPGVTAGGVYSPLVVPSNATPGAFINPPAGFAVFQVANNFRQDHVYSWNINVQRRITPTMSFQAAYVGNTGDHLYHDYQLNQCDPPEIVGLVSYPNCLPFYNINPNVTQVHFRNSGGASRYNAMQLQLQKRTSAGLTLTASYTWSKLFDNVDNPISPYATNQELVGVGWKNGNYPQNFTVSYSYDLPFGHGRKWMSGTSGAAQAALGGWQVSGISTFRAGGALLINASTSTLPPQADQQRANFTCGGQSLTNPHTISEWFQTGCFASPAQNTFGDAAIGTVYGPGLMNWDFSVNKSIPLGSETRDLKINFNFFNIFNRVNLNNPNTNVSSGASFGTINSDNGLPREMQMGIQLDF